MRVPGILVGVALLGLVAWRTLEERPSASASGSPARLASPAVPALPPDNREAPERSEELAREPPPEAREVQLQLLVAKARHSLAQAAARATSRGDFALAPGRLVQSLLERRCGRVRRHAEEIAAFREQLALEGSDGAGLCRSLLFSALKERLALPEALSQARFWELLEQVDAAYERLVLADPSTGSDEAFRAAYERFREARRDIVGAELDRRLFGLADEVLQLPFQVEELLRDPRTSAEQKLAAYDGALQRIEGEFGVRLASVVEPVELAKHALRLLEAAGPLSVEQQRAVLERYAGPEVAQRHLEHQQEQQDQHERREAFHQERERLLQQLDREGLSTEQLRQRMAEIDARLFEKYRLP